MLAGKVIYSNCDEREDGISSEAVLDSTRPDEVAAKESISEQVLNG
jgi:hypothetical protein